MNNLARTIVLTLAAVPFLAAAPVIKRTQADAKPAHATAAKSKVAKKHAPHVSKVKAAPVKAAPVHAQ